MKRIHCGLAFASLLLFCNLWAIHAQSAGGFSTVLRHGANSLSASAPCALASVSLFFQCGGGGGGLPPCNNPTVPVEDPGVPSKPCSPIILDLSGKGFFLTSADNGVKFDISGTGHPVQIAWTAPGADNAFLALDRNGNGIIDNGTELFREFHAAAAVR